MPARATDFANNPGPRHDKPRADEVAQHIRNARSHNPRFRAEAMRRLGQMRAAPDVLAEALNDQNTFVRSAAAEALGHFSDDPSPDIIDGLLAAIDDPNDYVCAAAIGSLGHLGVTEAREDIRSFLADREPAIVRAAIFALGRLGPPEVGAELVPFLDSPNYDLRAAAARAVGDLGYGRAADRLLDLLEDQLDDGPPRALKLPKTCIEALAKLQVPTAAPVLTTIAQEWPGLRSIAVQALMDLGAESAAPILATMLEDPSASLREHLVRLMVQADYRAALPLIRPLLRSDSARVRVAALRAVTTWRDLAAVALIRPMCRQDPSPHVRPHAVHSLATLLGREAIPDLVALLGDRNTAVRGVAAGRLAQFPDLPPAAAHALTTFQAEGQNPDYRPLPEEPATETTNSTLIPPAIQQDQAVLLTALEAWQAALGNENYVNLEQLAEVDRALATLIHLLQQHPPSPPA